MRTEDRLSAYRGPLCGRAFHASSPVHLNLSRLVPEPTQSRCSSEASTSSGARCEALLRACVADLEQILWQAGPGATRCPVSCSAQLEPSHLWRLRLCLVSLTPLKGPTLRPLLSST